MIITIDGPTASGKSSTAQAIAERLGFYYLNSGLLYRALAYVLLRYGNYTVETLSSVPEKDLMLYLNHNRFVYRYGGQVDATVRFDNHDITPFLKTAEIDQAASLLGTHVQVRDLLNNVQKTIANHHNTIVDGRDCGSVVFPDALIKFFLTASVEVRAQRWQQDQARKGVSIDLNEAIAHIVARDKRDTERAIGPLRIPDNARIIDNSLLTKQQTIDLMIDAIAAQPCP